MATMQVLPHLSQHVEVADDRRQVVDTSLLGPRAPGAGVEAQGGDHHLWLPGHQGGLHCLAAAWGA